MVWTIEYDEAAVKDLKKLDRQVQREILDFMEKRIGRAEDHRSFSRFPLLPSRARPRWEGLRSACPQGAPRAGFAPGDFAFSSIFLLPPSFLRIFHSPTPHPHS